MTNFRILATGAVLTLASLGGAALAGPKDTVQVFYDYLSNPGSQPHAQAFQDVTTDASVSLGDYSGQSTNRAAFVGQLGGFDKLIPDLDWKVEAMHQDGDTVVVRSRATGTPVGPFFGVDGQGRSFDIMTIDIHELEDGVIVRTYHVEDWAGALRQLSGH